MAEIVHDNNLLIVPQGERPIPENFLNFIWDNEIKVFLVKPTWVSASESGTTGMGIRVSPGSC